MTSATEAVPAAPARRASRAVRFGLVVTSALLLLFGVPWWTLVYAAGWPAGVTATGTVIFLAALVAFPVLMFRGHGRGVESFRGVG